METTYEVPGEVFEGFLKAYSADLMRDDGKVRSPMIYKLGEESASWITVANYGAREARCYRLMERAAFETQYPLDHVWTYKDLKSPKKKPKGSLLGDYHGCIVTSRRREWVLTGPEIAVKNADSSPVAGETDPKPSLPTPDARKLPRGAKMTTNATDQKIVEAMKEQVCKVLQEEAGGIMKAYHEAATEWGAGDHGDKKFRFSVGGGFSITMIDDQQYEVDAVVSYAVKRRREEGTLVRTGKDLVDAMNESE